MAAAESEYVISTEAMLKAYEDGLMELAEIEREFQSLTPAYESLTRERDNLCDQMRRKEELLRNTHQALLERAQRGML